MTKYIHYCWFGGKPLPKKVKKYMKTWKKYLPDYEIMEWNESNFDVNITKFSSDAYKNKKWAFVSDVARIYALKKFGGIYFDTDIEVTKNIDFILDNDIWLGREDENYLATAMIGVKEPENQHIINILKQYDDIKFDTGNMFEFTNPKIFTKYFNQYGLENGDSKQVLKKSIHIYPKEYFNPKSYDGKNNKFTSNTCIIHHFDGSWTAIDEKIAIWFVRHKMDFMAKVVFRFFNFLRKIKRFFRK